VPRCGDQSRENASTNRSNGVIQFRAGSSGPHATRYCSAIARGSDKSNEVLKDMKIESEKLDKRDFSLLSACSVVVVVVFLRGKSDSGVELVDILGDFEPEDAEPL
jgi:hypothetical protein